MEVSTARLTLRPHTLDDVDELHRLWTEPHVRRYLWDDVIIPRERAIETVDKCIASWSEHGYGQWAARLLGGSSIIGFAGLFVLDQGPGVELIYGLHPDYWGRGLATEASLAALRHGFEKAGLERIWARTDRPNEHSCGVMRRIGMRDATMPHDPFITYVIERREFVDLVDRARK